MSKTFAIADIHGRFDLLQEALSAIEARYDGGTVVFLGDYVDRGPESRSVLERLMAGPPMGWHWICLKGNHEAMMTETIGGPDEAIWLRNGGVETIASYAGRRPDRSHLHWCAALPMLHKDAHRAYVHAGVLGSLPLTEAAQGAEVLLWHRLRKGRDVHCSLHVVHGHTPVLDGPDRLEGRTNLDTGAVFTGRLVVGVFDDGTPGGPLDIIEVTCGTRSIWTRSSL